MSSCMASSFSQGDAFISSNPDRTMTFTSSPPSRREDRQQSMAVFAAAQHDHALADLVDVAERHRGQPVDADMDIGGGLVPAGDRQVAPARRAAADEDRVVVVLQQRLQAVDALAEPHLHAEVGDVGHLLVDDRLGEAEFGDLAADHAAGARVGIEQHQLVAERGQVARDRQRGGAGADQGNSLAVGALGGAGQAVGYVALVVGGHALEAADRHRLFLDPAAAAGRLAGPVTGAAEDAGEDVGIPVDHERIGVAAGGDHPDIFRHGRVGGARPLAIDHFVEVVGVPNVGRLQVGLLSLGAWSWAAGAEASGATRVPRQPF